MIRRLAQELEKPTFPINRDPESYEEELQVLVNGCNKNLNVLDQVLTKYNALSEQERRGRQLWQKIRFGNGKMLDIVDLRARLTYYTSAMTLLLNMVSMRKMGEVERQLHEAGGDLKEIKVSVNEIVARLMSESKRHEGSIRTAYPDDDRAVWKEFRRELIQDGFSSSLIAKHKKLIKSYIEELGNRGLLDARGPDDEAEKQDLKSGLSLDGFLSPDLETHSQGSEINEGTLKYEAEVQDLEIKAFVDGSLSPDLETHSQGSEINEGTPKYEAEEQDLESRAFVDGSLSPDLLETCNQSLEINERSPNNQEEKQNLESGPSFNGSLSPDLLNLRGSELRNRNADDEVEQQDLESNPFINSTLDMNLEIDRSLEIHGTDADDEAEEQDLESDPLVKGILVIDLEMIRSLEIRELNTDNKIEEQDPESEPIVDSTLGIDMETRRNSETLWVPQPLNMPNALKITKSFEYLSTIFEHRSKNVTWAKVHIYPTEIYFRRREMHEQIRRCRTESESHLAIIVLPRRTDPIDFDEENKQRFHLLVKTSIDHETVELFVFEDFDLALQIAQHTVQKSPRLSLEHLYESLDEMMTEWNREFIERWDGYCDGEDFSWQFLAWWLAKRTRPFGDADSIS